MAMERDADFVSSVMASQPVPSIDEEKDIGATDSSRGVICSSKHGSTFGTAEGASSRKRLHSGDSEESESESNKKLKQQPVKPTQGAAAQHDVSPDFTFMMNWMKQEFDGVKSNLTKTTDNRVDSLEEKFRNVIWQ